MKQSDKLIKEQEIEYKAMLTKESFDSLLTYFPQFCIAMPSYNQTNYYFDTEDYELHHQGVTVRIREKEETWELQVKIPEDNKGSYNQHQEIRQTISEEEAREYIKVGLNKNIPIMNQLFHRLKIEYSSLQIIGMLQTKRHDFYFYTDTISLDKSTYLGVTDYELEWETNNHLFATFELNRLHITPIKGEGKITRFFHQLSQE